MDENNNWGHLYMFVGIMVKNATAHEVLRLLVTFGLLRKDDIVGAELFLTSAQRAEDISKLAAQLPEGVSVTSEEVFIFGEHTVNLAVLRQTDGGSTLEVSSYVHPIWEVVTVSIGWGPVNERECRKWEEAASLVEPLGVQLPPDVGLLKSYGKPKDAILLVASDTDFNGVLLVGAKK